MNTVPKLLLLLFSFSGYSVSLSVNFEDKIHSYHEKKPDDPFAQLKNELESKKIDLNFQNEKDYLNWLLNELYISKHSQLLVYSTTSLQLSRISPYNPRAIYFSDDLYLGYVPGGQIEVIGIDPQLGAIPYIFDLPQKNEIKHPKIYRSTRCMKCHASQEFGGSPSLLLSSVIPAHGGGTIDSFRKNSFGHEIQFKDRFGGWHITGHNPFPISWANQIGVMSNNKVGRIPNPPGKYFKWEKYPTKSSSIISHLLLEHQVGFTNRCIDIIYRYRELISKTSNLEIDQKRKKFISQGTGKLLNYLLFKNEVPLENFRITSNDAFLNDFQTSSNNSSKLRRLNLKSRLFDYRCSYMIFSNSFSGLPLEFKIELFNQLFKIMAPKQKSVPDEFSYLEEKEREIIHQVLTASFPLYRNE